MPAPPRWPRRIANLLRELPAVLAGQVEDRHGLRRAFLSAFTHKLMELIHDAFVEKSDGGTDALGHSFRPLHPKTILRKSSPKFRRKHPHTLPEQIMRASDRLLKSLGPGNLVGIRRYPPANQVVEFYNNVIRIYSSVPYADFQFAMRPFYPENISPWIDEAIEAGNEAMTERLRGMLQ